MRPNERELAVWTQTKGIVSLKLDGQSLKAHLKVVCRGGKVSLVRMALDEFGGSSP